MASRGYILKIILLLQLYCVYTQKNYGPYILTVKRYDKCQGPKRYNCNNYSVAYDSDANMGIFEFNITKPTAIQQVKISAFTLKGGAKKSLMNYIMAEACQHFFVGPIIAANFNMTKGCVVEKGNFKMSLRVTEMVTTFLGKNFFYGEYEFKTLVMSKICNVFCMKSILMFTQIN